MFYLSKPHNPSKFARTAKNRLFNASDLKNQEEVQPSMHNSTSLAHTPSRRNLYLISTDKNQEAVMMQSMQVYKNCMYRSYKTRVKRLYCSYLLVGFAAILNYFFGCPFDCPATLSDVRRRTGHTLPVQTRLVLTYRQKGSILK